MTRGLTVAELAALPGIDAIEGDGDVIVTGVRTDSRQVQPGELFAAVVGAAADGTRFVESAVARGASAVLSQQPVQTTVPVLRCSDVRGSVGELAHRVYGSPSEGWPVVAITGTNGKTTVAYLVEAMLQQLWGPVALCGTVAMRGPASTQVAALTTPEADTLARFARVQRDAGARALVMEASSIALAQRRVSGLSVEVAAYTNLSQDHLDFHGDMQVYGEQKARLFVEMAPRHAVVCVDDAFGESLAERSAGRVWRCSSQPGVRAELAVEHWESSRDGLRARISTPAGPIDVSSPLIGQHNLQNLVVTLGIASALGVDLARAASALAKATGAPGRFERVADPRGTAIFVDYAHTPAAIARALEALRPITRGRLFIVVGCGGDRDAAKRAPMGQAAVRGADVAVLTSDNPRTEAPEAILEQVCAGALAAGALEVERTNLASVGAGFVRELDRSRAIEAAILAAGCDDTVLIAGKGHEDYQIVGTTKHPFDDRLKALEAVRSLGAG